MSPHVKSPLQLYNLQFYWLFSTTNGLSTWKTVGEAHGTFLYWIFCVHLQQFWLCVFIPCILFVPLWLFVVMLRCLFVWYQVYLWTFYVCLFIFIYLYSPTALVSHCITFTTLLFLFSALHGLNIVGISCQENNLTFVQSHAVWVNSGLVNQNT